MRVVACLFFAVSSFLLGEIAQASFIVANIVDQRLSRDWASAAGTAATVGQGAAAFFGLIAIAAAVQELNKRADH